MHFYYVFCQQDRDTLLEHGYTLVGEDASNNLWAFASPLIEKFDFSLREGFVLSDVLSL